MNIVIDTNVIVSALKSSKGKSFALINSLPNKKFKTALSIPLYIEYLDVLNRKEVMQNAFSQEETLAFCRYLLSISEWFDIHFLWRPLLPDPKDDMILEVAVAAKAEYIITFNIGDFRAAAMFGIKAVTPKDFIEIIGEQK